MVRRCIVWSSPALCLALAAGVAGQDTITIRYPVLRPNGRLQTDVAFYDQDLNPLSNGVEARRARLAIGGDLSNRLRFQLEIDLADDDAKLRDAWLMYDILPNLRFQTGNFKEPFTLESVTSSLWITFLERSLADFAFVPPRHLGAALRWNWAPFAVAAGVFGMDVGTEPGPDLLQSEAYGFVARGVAVPWLRERRVVHLGADLRWRKPDFEDDDSLFVQFEALSETHVDRIELYDTGPIAGGESYGQVAAEAALVYGSFSLQGEYIWTGVESIFGDPAFGGGYAFLSVIPTGESRTYDPVDGRFTGVSKLRHWYGAIELLGRYSRLDLNNEFVAGGAGHNWTAGLNWYPHRNIRFMANYVFTTHDAFATGDGEFAGDDDFSVFQFRIQYNF